MLDAVLPRGFVPRRVEYVYDCGGWLIQWLLRGVLPRSLHFASAVHQSAREVARQLDRQADPRSTSDALAQEAVLVEGHLNLEHVVDRPSQPMGQDGQSLALAVTASQPLHHSEYPAQKNNKTNER